MFLGEIVKIGYNIVEKFKKDCDGKFISLLFSVLYKISVKSRRRAIENLQLELNVLVIGIKAFHFICYKFKMKQRILKLGYFIDMHS